MKVSRVVEVATKKEQAAGEEVAPMAAGGALQRLKRNGGCVAVSANGARQHEDVFWVAFLLASCALAGESREELVVQF